MHSKPAQSPAAVPSPPKETFLLVVHCSSEKAQRELFERLAKEGFRCRVLTT